MGVHMAQGEGVDFWVVCPHFPSAFNGLIFKRNVLDLFVKSWDYFHTHNISLESTFHWLFKKLLKFEVDVGFLNNVQKCNTVSGVLASSKQQAVTQSEVIRLCCHSDNNRSHLIRPQLEQIYKYAIRLAGQRWNLKFLSVHRRNYMQFSFFHCSSGNFGGLYLQLRRGKFLILLGDGTLQCHHFNI